MPDRASASDYVDGNALARPLSDVFVVDVSAAETTCVGCGRRSMVES